MRTLGLILIGLLTASPWVLAQEVRVGSKVFTESVILGEITVQRLRHTGTPAIHRRELGGTRVLWSALQRGEIDLYPEYTGTLAEEIFAGRDLQDEEAIRRALAEEGMRMSLPLGFENTYALGMKEEVARELGIRTISDLRLHPGLTFGLSNEFRERRDGWPGLRQHYGLPHTAVRGLDHDLAYRGLDSGAVQVIDIYSTDAEIQYYGLRSLKDDLEYFPRYDAVLVYRAELPELVPQGWKALRKLEGLFSQQEMVAMNARAKLDRVAESLVAADFLFGQLGTPAVIDRETKLSRLIQNTRAHLFLVAVSLSAAILLSIPLGVLAAKRSAPGQLILALVGTIQTIPSLALLVFMIPLLGIGTAPAIAALFLYSLLPIVRNTYAGLHDIPPQIRESAAALGLPPLVCLLRVELPLASRAILAGIKTSAVINVGTATLGALIGAGGYGQPILTGIRLDDMGLILEGAVPAAALALTVQALFELFERALVPKGLRLNPGR